MQLVGKYMFAGGGKPAGAGDGTADSGDAATSPEDSSSATPTEDK